MKFIKWIENICNVHSFQCEKKKTKTKRRNFTRNSYILGHQLELTWFILKFVLDSIQNMCIGLIPLSYRTMLIQPNGNAHTHTHTPDAHHSFNSMNNFSPNSCILWLKNWNWHNKKIHSYTFHSNWCLSRIFEIEKIMKRTKKNVAKNACNFALSLQIIFELNNCVLFQSVAFFTK